jgi:hypothetical protein
MNIPFSINLIPSLSNKMWEKLRQIYEQLATAFNGNIEFGNPTSGPANLRLVWASLTTPGAPNTDFTVTHNLGRPAVAYIVTTTNQYVNLQTSPTANPNPNTQIILQASVASAVITMILF